jgi:methyl-accepting chemotaxis protein
MSLEDEIAKAIDTHATWKVSLSRAIESGTVDVSVADVKQDNLCAFGKWLHGSTIPNAARLDPNYIIVRHIHANFHECAARVLELVLQGNKAQADALMAADGEYTKISGQLVAMMLKWQQAVAKR